MKISKSLNSTRLGILFATVVLGVLGICLYHDLTKISWTVKERTNIRKSLFHATQLVSYLADAESGQRGFLLTGEDFYLGPYHEAIQKIESHLTLMKTETIATRDPKNWKEVEALINERLFHLGETLKKRRQRGDRPSLAVTPSHEGRIVMEKIRERLATMQAQEKEHLDILLAQYDQKIHRHTILLVMQGVVLMILAGLVWMQKKRPRPQTV